MVSEIAALRKRIKELEADSRRIKSEQRLKAQLHVARRKHVKARFSGFVGQYLRAGMDFKAAVKAAKKAYDKI